GPIVYTSSSPRRREALYNSHRLVIQRLWAYRSTTKTLGPRLRGDDDVQTPTPKMLQALPGVPASTARRPETGFRSERAEDRKRPRPRRSAARCPADRNRKAIRAQPQPRLLGESSPANAPSLRSDASTP